jgi:uncharacterized membrane protein YadS
MKLVGVKPRSWLPGFSVIYFVSMLLWVIAYYQPLTKIIGSAELGYVFALIVGMVLGNMGALPRCLRDSAKGEFFIKTAIVLLGAKILFTTILTNALPILSAVFLAFPITWIVAYLLSRKMGLDQKFAAVLSSGVGICGISAAIATASAIEAPPLYATLIASIIVVFAAIELLVLPFVAANIFSAHHAAAGVWMGLSVKTDGAAVAAGTVASGLLGEGAGGVPLQMAATTKVLMDIWIGLIAFILAIVFAYFVERRQGAKVSPMVLWYRFPKFVLGYLFTSIAVSALAFTYPTVAAGESAVTVISNFGTTPLQVAFFTFTFMSIGITARVSNLRQVELEKPLVTYVIALLFAIVWGGILAYIFFAM